MKLTREEKDYLFTKVEYRKRKNAIENKTKLYELLKGDKEDFSEDEISLVVKSLEFTFRKRLEGSKPDLSNELFQSIKSKLPDSIVIVKQSSINYKPTKSSTKKEIINYLTAKKIPFEKSDTKTQLLSLLESRVVIKRFNEF